MNNLFPGTLARLELGDAHCVALGTFRLDGVVEAEQQDEEHADPPTASTSTSGPAWKTFIPGLWNDVAVVGLSARRKRLARPAAGGSRSTSTHSRGATKRKRSDSASFSGSTGPVGNSEVLPEVPVPTLQEIDHLVRNAFIAAEYLPLPGVRGDSDEHIANDACERTESYILRIYAIPLDAPGLDSRIKVLKLNIRSETSIASAQKRFAKLLCHLKYDDCEWRTGLPGASPSTPYLLARDPNVLSIHEVYNQLEDPKPQKLDGLSENAQNVLDGILKKDAPEGMCSRLYDFQKACLWKLAAKELAPQTEIDLTFREFTSIDCSQRRYYTDANSMIWNSAQFHPEPKAAILSEGMGTGKTCICLALVLALKHQLAKGDQLRGDSLGGTISSRRTALSESFPWRLEEEAGIQQGPAASIRRTRGTGPGTGVLAGGPRTLNTVPSLFNLALDLVHSHIHFTSSPVRDDNDLANTDVDVPYVWEPPPPKGRSGTRSTPTSRQKVFISATTLIIVPDILVAQWLAEISKHVTEGALNYIKIEKDDIVPEAEELAKLDLVLVSETKIRLEESRFGLVVQPLCRCPYKGSTREIVCKCKKVIDPGVSPLVAVWWKRLIVDEGHKVAGNGELVQMCMRLRTESCYVVSGTPSTNLVGLNDIGIVEHDHQTESSNKGDKSDFERLSKICNFLGMQPFCSQPGLFMKTFYEPYRMRGDTSGIQAFFARTMVRHKVPGVDMPPLTRQTVMLEFNEHERITYNVLLALFISNSILSEREDEDYFFHPKNKGALSSLLNNLGAAHLLYSSNDLHVSAEQSYKNNEQAIVQNSLKMPHLQWSEADVALINQAQACFRAAFDTDLWKPGQKGSMLYCLENTGINPELLRFYKGLTLEEPSTITVFPGEQLTFLRAQIGKLAEDPEWEFRLGAELEVELIKMLWTVSKCIKWEPPSSVDSTDPEEGSEPTPPPETKRRRLQKDTRSAIKAGSRSTKTNSENTKGVYTYQHIPVESGLHNALVPSVLSTKVAYVVKSVLSHPNEKFLVFAGGSSSHAHAISNNLFYLAEGLDLANLPFLVFTKTLSQAKLAAYAKAFNESTSFRVLLLDLKFAGRGLTLSTATRIIFTEPVWHKDEEAQAVKRAHRLGQHRPVHVETLIMKDSFEEKVMQRGAELSRRETAGAKTPYQDKELSAALRDLTFLPDRPGLERPLFTPLEPPLRLVPSHSHDTERQDLDNELEGYRQEALNDLSAHIDSHGGSGSASRSRS